MELCRSLLCAVKESSPSKVPKEGSKSLKKEGETHVRRNDSLSMSKRCGSVKEGEKEGQQLGQTKTSSQGTTPRDSYR